MILDVGYIPEFDPKKMAGKASNLGSLQKPGRCHHETMVYDGLLAVHKDPQHLIVRSATIVMIIINYMLAELSSDPVTTNLTTVGCINGSHLSCWVVLTPELPILGWHQRHLPGRTNTLGFKHQGTIKKHELTWIDGHQSFLHPYKLWITVDSPLIDFKTSTYMILYPLLSSTFLLHRHDLGPASDHQGVCHCPSGYPQSWWVKPSSGWGCGHLWCQEITCWTVIGSTTSCAIAHLWDRYWEDTLWIMSRRDNLQTHQPLPWWLDSRRWMITKIIRAASRCLLCKLLKILNQFTIGGPHGLSTHGWTSVAVKMALTDTLTNMIKHRCHIRQHHHHCQDQHCRHQRRHHHHSSYCRSYHQYHGLCLLNSPDPEWIKLVDTWSNRYPQLTSLINIGGWIPNEYTKNWLVVATGCQNSSGWAPAVLTSNWSSPLFPSWKSLEQLQNWKVFRIFFDHIGMIQVITSPMFASWGWVPVHLVGTCLAPDSPTCSCLAACWLQAWTPTVAAGCLQLVFVSCSYQQQQ